MDDVLEIWAILGPFLGGLITWSLTQFSKWKWERRVRKEERYKGFLNAITGFYQGSESAKKKTEFILELRFAWLYCPDDIIRGGNRFLDTVSANEKKPTDEKQPKDEEKETALGELVLALRRDMIGKTNLKASDYKLWKSLD